MMVGANRILRGTNITYVCGNKNLPKEEEKKLNERYLERALEILQMPIEEQTIFALEE